MLDPTAMRLLMILDDYAPPCRYSCDHPRCGVLRELVGLVGDAMPEPEQIDARDVFAKLVAEVDAGRALVAMTPLGERHRAAVDALTLARCVLDDARDLFAHTMVQP